MTGPIAFLRTSVVGRIGHYAWSWLGPARKRLFLSPFLAGSLTIAETAMLLLAARLLLGFVEQQDRLEVGRFGIDSIGFYEGCLLGLGLALVTGLLRYVDSRFTAGLASISIRSARNSLLESAFNTPWQKQRSRRLGELQRLLATNGIAAAVPVMVIATVLNAGSAVVVYLIIILMTSPQLLLVVVALVLALVGAFAPLRRTLKRKATEHTQAIAALQLDSTSYSALQREIELYAVQNESLDVLRRSNRHLASVFRQQRFLQRFVPPLYQLALMTSVIVAVAFARFADLTVAGVGIAALLLLRSLSYVQQLNGNVQTAIEALPLLDEIEAYVDDSREAMKSHGNRPLDRVSTIELRDVSYSYGDEPVITGVNLRLAAGDRVGVVGTSGGGKSTLANLLVRLTDATTGQILVNGEPITDFSRKSWADAVALVGQEPLLLRGTIAENVRLYRDADDDDVERALLAANLLEEIRAFPAGMQTAVGEGWSSLSGGQRQRLGIARALLTGPSLLVLDEPSSALDANTEREIEAALANLDPDTIVVVISHRPLLLERCTRVLGVAGGRVTEDASRPSPAAAG